jgi:hypothetical protein
MMPSYTGVVILLAGAVVLVGVVILMMRLTVAPEAIVPRERTPNPSNLT